MFSRFGRAYPRLAALTLGLTLALVLAGAIELLCLGLNRHRRSNTHIQYLYSRKFHQPDELLGYKPIPSIRADATKKVNDRIIYETSYTFDACSRRITPLDSPGPRRKFIAFFGCSLIFGQGVREDETMPYYVGRLAPDYTPYNYGFSGNGPQMMLAKLQEGRLPKELIEGSGILVYLFFGPHIGRATGSMQEYNKASHDLPYYVLNSRNELVRQGTFTSGRPLLSLFYRVVGRSQFGAYFNLNIPPNITEAQIRLTARIIEDSCRSFHRLYPGNDFYLMIYSGNTHLSGVIPELRQAGIIVLDYTHSWWRRQPGYSFRNDGHPTAAAYRELAGYLVRDLGLVFPQKDRIPRRRGVSDAS